MKHRLVLGIMSGTSIDGVDYALCRIGGAGIELRALWSARFPARLRQQLHAAARGDLKSHDLAQAHHDLGRFYAAHAVPPGKASGEHPELAGLHGQTVFHNPSRRNPAMLQLGEPAYLVERLQIPVVSNFRAADMAAGGQGAPLATVFHQFVFARRGSHICVNNLGGISNVTSLDWRAGARPVVRAFDTGPANVLIDMAMRKFTHEKLAMDRGGRWAALGQAREWLIDRWLRHEYFRRSPPKSTGRELFGEPFFDKAMREMAGISKHDVVATLTEFTARSLELNYRLHLPSLPSRLILTGGGASNPFLVRAIAKRIGTEEVEICSSEAMGWPVQAIEPAAFALLASMRIAGRPGNLPETTGARHPAMLGQVSIYAFDRAKR